MTWVAYGHSSRISEISVGMSYHSFDVCSHLNLLLLSAYIIEKSDQNLYIKLSSGWYGSIVYAFFDIIFSIFLFSRLWTSYCFSEKLI